MTAQTTELEWKAKFEPIAKQLTENEEKINSELIGAQGKPQEIGGYYKPNQELMFKAMRPSATFNSIPGHRLAPFPQRAILTQC